MRTMGNKSKAKKKRLAKANRKASRAPLWVVAKTNRKVLQLQNGRKVNPKGRHWRRGDTDE